MKKNVGSIDKIIRLVLAAVIVVLFFAKVITGILAIVALLLAGILVITSIVGVCPLYMPFGLNSNTEH